MIPSSLESEHNSKVAGHIGQEKTIVLLRRNFWWSRMHTNITAYIQACQDYQWDKSWHPRRYGLLLPLELPYVPWQSIAMDIITNLPQSNRCTELCLVLDQFSIMAHFIPLEEEKKTAKDLARIFAQEKWRLHCLPRDMVSDRDSRFTSNTRKDCLAVTGIRPRMSTTFYTQTDGQTERVHQVIEAYLCPFLNQDQDDWVDLPPKAEHAYNSSMTSVTWITVFYANYRRHPELQNPQRTEVMNSASHTYAHWIAGALDRGKKALDSARERMIKYADTRRTLPPAYEVGNAVMLYTAHLKLKRPSQMLDNKFIGLFPIQQFISPTAVRLMLPHKWKSFPTFHVTEVDPFVEGNCPIQYEQRLCNCADIEADEEYDMDEIKGSIKRQISVLYHIKWLGIPKKKDWTFEPYEIIGKIG